MRGSIAAEWLKLRKRPAVWLIAGVWLILDIVFGYVLPYLGYLGAVQDGPGASRGLATVLPENLVASATQGLPMFAGALAMILGVLVTGSEYGWSTVKTMFTQRPRRLGVLGAKAVVLAGMLAGILVTSFLVDAGASAVIAGIESQPLVWPGVGELAGGAGAAWLIVAMWCAAGMFLGVLVRGTALAIGLGLVWALAVENLLRGFASMLDVIDVAQRWLPGTNAGSMAAALSDLPSSAPGVTSVVSGTHAALVLGAYVVAFIVAAAALTRRRDVT
jgi:ABC-2 type transport system permease protein